MSGHGRLDDIRLQRRFYVHGCAPLERLQVSQVLGGLGRHGLLYNIDVSPEPDFGFRRKRSGEQSSSVTRIGRCAALFRFLLAPPFERPRPRTARASNTDDDPAPSGFTDVEVYDLRRRRSTAWL